MSMGGGANLVRGEDGDSIVPDCQCDVPIKARGQLLIGQRGQCALLCRAQPPQLLHRSLHDSASRPSCILSLTLIMFLTVQ